MANWCYSTIYFKGHMEQIEKLYALIGLIGDSNNLYEVCTKAGIQEKVDSGEIACRGTIAGVSEIDVAEDNGNWYFSMLTSTAWVPMINMWYEIFAHLSLDKIKLTYQAEESGMDLFIIYDPDNLGFFKETVFIDFSYDGNLEEADTKTSIAVRELEDVCGAYTEKDALEILKSALMLEYDDLDHVIDWVDANFEIGYPDCFISIHRYEKIDYIDF